MELINTNHFRLSVSVAPRSQGPARKLAQFIRYNSNDHGRGTEHNYSLWIWSWNAHFKHRPNGKRREKLYDYL